MKECEVQIRFNVTPEQRDDLFKAEEYLRKAGISFDTGGTCQEKVGGKKFLRDWEFDWSLKGPVKVFYRRDRK